jgi:hypothetical protein
MTNKEAEENGILYAGGNSQTLHERSGEERQKY